MTPSDPAQQFHHGEPLVSVCIASYNHEAYIGEAIESALAQTYRNIEIVVVDDASQDGTAAIVRDFAARFPDRVRAVLLETNIGAPAAQNRAFHEARGEFAAILGSDDRMRPARLARQIAFLQANPDFVGVFSDIDAIDAKGAPSPHRAHIEEIFNRPFSNLRRQLLSGNFLNAPSATLRRADFLAAGGYNVALRYLHDFDLWGRLLLRGELGKLPERLTEYRIHGANLSVFGEAGAPFRVRCEIVATIVEFVRSWPHERILEETLETDADRAQAMLRLAALLQKVDLHYLHKPQLGCAYAYQLILEASRLAPDTDPTIKRDLERLLEEGFDPELAAAAALESSSGRTEAPGPQEAADSPERRYRQWLDEYQRAAADLPRFAMLHPAALGGRPTFQIIVRHSRDASVPLAATLSSLAAQHYPHWRVDVVSDQPYPEALPLSNSSLTWHTAAGSSAFKTSIDAATDAAACDWIVEVPPGARLDPLCLLRVALLARSDAGRESPANAVYLDDDVMSAAGERGRPRFKPDFDPEWLNSADLLGPLFVRHEAWRAIDGASTDRVAPWYDMALRLNARFGPAAFAHIDAPLISLPEPTPESARLAAQTCRRTLQRHLQRQGINAPVRPASPDTWRVHHPLNGLPTVTIAVPSQDKPEVIEHCIESILSLTAYASYEILIVDGASQSPDTEAYYARLQARREAPLRIHRHDSRLSFARFANIAAREARGDYLLLMQDDVRALQASWLSDLLAHASRADVCAVAPRLATPPDGRADQVGYIPGLDECMGTPDRAASADPDFAGYLGVLAVDRSAAALPGACLLLARKDFIAAGGADEEQLPQVWCDADLTLRLRRHTGRRCQVAAGVVLARVGGSCLEEPSASAEEAALLALGRARARTLLRTRWFDEFAGNRFWSRHLDQRAPGSAVEVRCVPPWNALPAPVPRFISFPLGNAQGDYRVSRPLEALQRAGKVLSCRYRPRPGDAADLPAEQFARHAPDVLLVQQALLDAGLANLRAWRAALPRSFIVYALDDLLTDMPKASSLRAGVPVDARSRLAEALSHCHRLVVSTPYLAQAYRHMIDDIRIVPNRLQRDVWLPLHSARRTTARPRVGWAGGTAHAGDLSLIAEVIAATAHEVDWVFMGMCPDHMRPMIREFHPFENFDSYPARLASLNLDLAVAPLEQIPFNRGKSNLRLLEYGALGIPVVCTDIDPYRDSPACRVGNRPRDWLDAIRARIHDPDAAEREGQTMRQWVLDHYILEDHLGEWLAAHLPG